MGKFKIVFSDLALNDLEEIVLYIANDSRENAIKFYDKIIGLSKKLEIFPKLGLLSPDKKMSIRGYRMLIIDKYIIFYIIQTDEIRILRVLHGSRDYPRVFGDMNSK